MASYSALVIGVSMALVVNSGQARAAEAGIERNGTV